MLQAVEPLIERETDLPTEAVEPECEAATEAVEPECAAATEAVEPECGVPTEAVEPECEAASEAVERLPQYEMGVWTQEIEAFSEYEAVLWTKSLPQNATALMTDASPEGKVPEHTTALLILSPNHALPERDVADESECETVVWIVSS